jgi:hypothetical protein
LEGAVAVAPQHFHNVVQAVGDGEVEIAVAVEVAHGDSVVLGGRPREQVGGDGAPEGAVAVAQEHADTVLEIGRQPRVQGHDVLVAVVVVVRRHQGYRGLAHRERARGRKTETEQSTILQRLQG